MKVLLTGATGLIGQQLGRALVANGHSVSCLVRDEKKARGELSFPCDLYTWNSEQQLPCVDAVIHLAGEPIAGSRWNREFKEKILSSRVEGTRQLLAKIKKGVLPTPKIFLSASAIGYYGDRGDETLDERSAPGAGFLYRACTNWEQEAFVAKEFIPRVAVIRIGIVLARAGGALSEMIPIFQKGIAGKLGSGNQWMSWIHIDDLVNLFLFALENDSVKGVLNGVAPRPVTNAVFTEILAKQLQVPAFFAVPKIVLRIILGEMSCLVLFGQKVSSELAQKLGFQFRYPELTLALENLFPETKRFGARAHIFEVDQWIPAKMPRVFDFFSSAQNLEKITPPFLGFRILKQSTEQIAEGTTIDYALKIHHFPARWKTRILQWRPEESFVDFQEKGPYQLWHHTHTFVRLGDGVHMRDTVAYRLPGWFLGDLLLHFFIRKDIQTIFQYRRKVILEEFPAEK